MTQSQGRTSRNRRGKHRNNSQIQWGLSGGETKDLNIPTQFHWWISLNTPLLSLNKDPGTIYLLLLQYQSLALKSKFKNSCQTTLMLLIKTFRNSTAGRIQRCSKGIPYFLVAGNVIVFEGELCSRKSYKAKSLFIPKISVHS